MDKYDYALTLKRQHIYGDYMTMLQSLQHADRTMAEHDFLYLLAGEWEIAFDDRTYRLRPDDILLLRAGHHHYGVTPCTPGTKAMFLHFTPARSGETVSLPPLIHCEYNLEVKRLFGSLISLVHARPETTRDYQLAATLNLLLCQLQQTASNQSGFNKNYHLVSKAVEMMESRPEHFYSVRELTEALDTTAKTLNKYFHEIFDMSAYQYQMDLKLEAVYNFLGAHPDEKLKNVALNFGFYDEFYLSKMFKKKYGAAPSVVKSSNPASP